MDKRNQVIWDRDSWHARFVFDSIAGRMLKSSPRHCGTVCSYWTLFFLTAIYTVVGTVFIIATLIMLPILVGELFFDISLPEWRDVIRSSWGLYLVGFTGILGTCMIIAIGVVYSGVKFLQRFVKKEKETKPPAWANNLSAIWDGFKNKYCPLVKFE